MLQQVLLQVWDKWPKCFSDQFVQQKMTEMSQRKKNIASATDDGTSVSEYYSFGETGIPSANNISKSTLYWSNDIWKCPINGLNSFLKGVPRSSAMQSNQSGKLISRWEMFSHSGSPCS